MSARGAAHRAFTLLEAVVALVILAGVVLAAAQVRAQVLASARDLAHVHRAEHAVADLFRMAVDGAIHEPEIDPDTGERRWAGEYLGGEYEIVRTIERVANPVANQTAYAARERVSLFRYTVRYAGEDAEYVWYR